MAKIRITLDINVLYAGLYSSEGTSYQILRAIERGQIQIILSTTLLFEYEDISNRKKSELGLSEKQIEAVLNNLCRLSVHQKIYYYGGLS
jgi:predicted nucleic acid-binding protein